MWRRASLRRAKAVPTNHRARILLVAAGLVATAAGAYYNSLLAPFVFDDPLAITENPTIRRLWPLTDVLFPPRGEGLSVEGRPVLNLTLAIKYALGRTSVRGYHVADILIHALATLTLFGLVRRTFLLPRLVDRFGTAALPLAGIIALLWSAHPLQTGSAGLLVVVVALRVGCGAGATCAVTAKGRCVANNAATSASGVVFMVVVGRTRRDDIKIGRWPNRFAHLGSGIGSESEQAEVIVMIGAPRGWWLGRGTGVPVRQFGCWDAIGTPRARKPVERNPGGQGRPRHSTLESA